MTAVYRDIHSRDWRVCLDLSGQRLELNVPEFESGWGRDGELLYPTLSGVHSSCVSAAMLLQKAKQFDDGLYAAVDLVAQTGAGRFAGKQVLLRSLVQSLLSGLPESAEAAKALYTACEVGRIDVEAPPGFQGCVRSLAADFLRNELASKPLGFYTWTPELNAIFRQDRFLQQPLDAHTADVLVRALGATPRAAATYRDCLHLNARLTNPSAGPGLRDRAERRSFFPASRSHEQVLVERLYGDRPIPANFDLVSELISRIRSGEINLEPTQESGWYDYQAWSIEPLVSPERMPEVTHLTSGKRYCDYLEEVFRGALALARETHVKQLALALGGAAGPEQESIYVNPGLTVEPLPTLYARKAASYRFIRSVLEETFGIETLAEVHGRTPDGLREMPLAAELTFLEKLFDGAAATSRRELGVDANPNDAVDVQRFMDWAANVPADPDVNRDSRMMVPVFYDRERRLTKVWAVLGWRPVTVRASYTVAPAVVSVERSKPPEPEPTDRLSVLRRKFRPQLDSKPSGPPAVRFSNWTYTFAAPVMSEVYVSGLLNRDEFREHCDRHRTSRAILANLR